MVRNNAINCRKWRAKQGEAYKRKENLRVKSLYVPMALQPNEEQEKLREPHKEAGGLYTPTTERSWEELGVISCILPDPVLMQCFSTRTNQNIDLKCKKCFCLLHVNVREDVDFITVGKMCFVYRTIPFITTSGIIISKILSKNK